MQKLSWSIGSFLLNYHLFPKGDLHSLISFLPVGIWFIFSFLQMTADIWYYFQVKTRNATQYNFMSILILVLLIWGNLVLLFPPCCLTFLWKCSLSFYVYIYAFTAYIHFASQHLILSDFLAKWLQNNFQMCTLIKLKNMFSLDIYILHLITQMQCKQK